MAKNSGIEWTDHTFNPWWGCQKVSPGCQHCYAETLSNRFEKNIWGPPHATSRRTFGEKHWRAPLMWNAQAEKAGVPARVFCSSMADVFEAHPDVESERDRLFDLIEQTPWLTWLLLTKRPENVPSMTPRWHDGWPTNVWLGTSVEDQERANQRIPDLLAVPASRRFLSCEPLLEWVTFRWAQWVGTTRGHWHLDGLAGIDWVIVGGESGPGARPMHPLWVTTLRDECVAAEVAFFFKQWGAWRPVETFGDRVDLSLYAEPDAEETAVSMTRVGKKLAGRDLLGRTWNEIPALPVPATQT